MLKIIIILLAATSIATVHAQVGTGSVSFQSSDSLFLQNTFQSQMQLMDSFIAIPMPQLGPYMQSQRNKKEIKKLQLIREALYPDGNINAALKADSIFMHQQTNTANRNSGCVNAAWQPVGPIGDPQGHPTQNKNGRLDCIAFKVSDPNTIYVGSGSGIVTLGGGAWLWKVNGTTGQAAFMKTDKLTLHNGVAAIAPLSWEVVYSSLPLQDFGFGIDLNECGENDLILLCHITVK